MRKLFYILIVLVVIATAGYFGHKYYSDHKQNQTLTTQSQGSNSSTKKAPEQTLPKTYPVGVYFSKRPDSDNDPSKVFAVSRTSPNLVVGKFAITELLKGPTGSESAQGYFTTAQLRSGESNCNGNDFILTIENSTATLKFCRVFNHLGVVADGQADSELKATLKQFSTVKKVIILNKDGNCEFDLSGMNLCKQ